MKECFGNTGILKQISSSGNKYNSQVVTLILTEQKLCMATSCAQDMLFVSRLMIAMDLRVKIPMIVQCNNKGAKNLIMGGKRHVDVWLYILQDLNKNKLIQMNWVDDSKNLAVLGMKNLDA